MSDYTKFRYAFAKARLRDPEGTRYSTHIHGVPFCDAPVPIALKHGRFIDWAKRPNRALEITMFGPCRKCEKCLQYRKLKWRERAMYEMALAPRNWLVTLTLSPRMLAIAIADAKAAGKTLEPVLYGELKKYFKRLRAQGATFRYLAVHELGEKTGRSHYHVILHEVRGQSPVRKALIEAKWPAHVHARLVGSTRADIERSSGYVTTYTTKSFDCRPRASIRYGPSAA